MSGSKVIQARLHPDNGREAEALQIFELAKNQGYSSREIITGSLLALGQLMTTYGEGQIEQLNHSNPALEEQIKRLESLIIYLENMTNAT